MRTHILRALAAALLFGVTAVRADWHSGKVKDIYYSYDGIVATFTLVGFNKVNCTCYSAWSDRMCLSRTRASYKEEIATVLTAKATGQTIVVNIDEASCVVLALGVE